MTDKSIPFREFTMACISEHAVHCRARPTAAAEVNVGFAESASSSCLPRITLIFLQPKLPTRSFLSSFPSTSSLISWTLILGPAIVCSSDLNPLWRLPLVQPRHLAIHPLSLLTRTVSYPRWQSAGRLSVLNHPVRPLL